MDLSIKEALKADLLSAIKNNQFVLHYQPQINVINSRVEAVEALIRWQHPTRGLFTPVDFLSVVEESGLIVRLGHWVLEAACLQNKLWQEQGLPPIRVAVNVSGRQFQQKDFVESVMKILSKTQLKPKYLEIELTENIILRDEEKVINQIQRLKNLGISIALDDFGTGYSSISYLKKVPVDRIKIDKTFIQNLLTNKSDETIIRAIILLAEGLNLRVVAEGVETLDQLKELQSYRCHEMQGYYFSKPLPASELEQFLKSIQP